MLGPCLGEAAGVVKRQRIRLCAAFGRAVFHCCAIIASAEAGAVTLARVLIFLRVRRADKAGDPEE